MAEPVNSGSHDPQEKKKQMSVKKLSYNDKNGNKKDAY